MARSLQVYFTNRRGYYRQNFNWGGGPITRQSVVHIAISEASYDPGNPPASRYLRFFAGWARPE
jgi:hypothetical protein